MHCREFPMIAMDPTNSDLDRYYEQFNRDHERLREELLAKLPSSAATKTSPRTKSYERICHLQFFVGRRRWAALATAGLVFMVVSVALLRDYSGSIAYADVLSRVESLRSVQYTRTLVYPADQDQRARVLVLGRYLERQEHLAPDGSILLVTIINLRTGAIISLDPANRRCEILSRERIIDPDGTQKVKDVQPAPQADIFRSVQSLPPNAEPTFSEKEIDGQDVVGFFHEDVSGVYIWNDTYWVDKDTMLPVRVEKKGLSTNRQWLAMEWLWSDFVFDEELDPSLFSTEPPAGYSVQESEIQGFQMPTK
jgi:hypothetical protein